MWVSDNMNLIYLFSWWQFYWSDYNVINWTLQEWVEGGGWLVKHWYTAVHHYFYKSTSSILPKNFLHWISGNLSFSVSVFICSQFCETEIWYNFLICKKTLCKLIRCSRYFRLIWCVQWACKIQEIKVRRHVPRASF